LPAPKFSVNPLLRDASKIFPVWIAPPMNRDSKRFFGELESLRGIAALIVVLHHTHWTNPLTSLRFFRNGYLMVDLFFVLSGFVIYHNYSQKISSIKDILKFMFLRLGRLYPLHLFYLLIFLGVEIVKYMREPRFGLMPHETDAFTINNMTSFMANLLLIQPFFSSTNITFNAPSWSIGVEFYTYLVFAFVVLFCPGKRKFTFASCFAVSLAIFLLSFWMWAGLSSDAGINFLRCILGFFAGTLAYQAYSSYRSHIARWSEAIMWVAAIFLFFFLSLHSNLESDFIVLPVFVLLIVSAAAPSEGGGLMSIFLNSTPLRWMGAVSYSIYMAHWIILAKVARIFAFAEKHCNPDARNWMGLPFVFLAVLLVLVVSQFTYKWIERPCQKKFQNYIMARRRA
jgi:peptidoglycan/LPS O-acetylase OafA/YrhL